MALIEKISGVIKNRILQGREFKERKLTVIIRLDERFRQLKLKQEGR